MKKNNNMRTFFGKLMIAFAVCACIESCTHEELDNNSSKYGASISFGISGTGPKTKSAAKAKNAESIICTYNEPNSIGITVSAIDGIEKTIEPAQLQTKGTQLNSLSRFGVAAYYFSEDKNGSKFFTDTVNDGTNTNDQTYMWPSSGTLNFIASQPAKLIKQFGATETGNYTFNYTIPADVKEQQDVMFATANGLNNSETGDPVGLAFQHLLAAVQFKVGDMQFIHINSITLSGLNGGEITFAHDPNNATWQSSLATPTDLTYTFTKDNSTLIDTDGLPKGSDITGNSNNTMLFVAPQTIGEDNKLTLTVNYTALLTNATESKTIDLPQHVLEAGKTTVYSLNIGQKFNVTIPTPEDQDAHYIMLEMNYDLGDLNNENLKDITASARFLDDGSNNSTKSGISLTSSLTETQRNGYWSDELWELKYEIKSDGSTDPVNPTPKYVKKIRGEEQISITNQVGKIYLFIEENNGTTDRNGELIITAKLPDDTPITLGRGSFKQLSPYWNNNIGIERFENANSYPYGFDYNRKVTYTSNINLDALNWPIVGAIYKFLLLLFGGVTNEVVPDNENIADGFVTTETVDIWGNDVTYYVELNYSALSKVSTVASNSDGLTNTRALYNFSGNTDISELENQLDENIADWKKVVLDNSSIPEEYAAFVALKCNRMREIYVEITTQEGSSNLYRVSLHKDAESKGVEVGGSIDESSNDIIEWYLPSSEEAKTLKEVGTGTEEPTPISPLNGTYWSSTAGSDADAQAHSYTFTNNTFGQINTTTERMAKHKVRAVRKKPTAN